MKTSNALHHAVPLRIESVRFDRHYKRLLMVSEEHFSRSKSGAIYARGPANYSFWSRYLGAFDEVIVLARVRSSQGPEDDCQRADGPNVFIRSLPDYVGPLQHFLNQRISRRIARQAIKVCDAYLLRVPGLVSRMVRHELCQLKKAYAVEVLGDPWEALKPGTWPGIFRPVYRYLGMNQMKRTCDGAIAINYVTSETLQQRYPPSKDAYAVSFSDVMLQTTEISTHIFEKRKTRLGDMPWREARYGTPIRIGFVGRFLFYKGPDVILRASALCRNHLNFQLIMIGKGRHLGNMKALASELGVQDYVDFAGELSSGSSIFEFLDSIDLFVMPSRAEGLPRALVEAMSRGCPCIASAVGGIPELLEPSDLVPPDSPEALAKLILQVAADSDRLLAMSARNLAKATQFSPQTLNESRRAFLEEIKRRSSLLSSA
jgi:phosphatidylinositol alpha-1,6-mannosyltransferase